jgi:hypothetical protein
MSRANEVFLRNAALTVLNAHGSVDGSVKRFDNGLLEITVFAKGRKGRGLTVNYRPPGAKPMSTFCTDWTAGAAVTTLCLPGLWQAELRKLATEIMKKKLLISESVPCSGL